MKVSFDEVEYLEYALETVGCGAVVIEVRPVWVWYLHRVVQEPDPRCIQARKALSNREQVMLLHAEHDVGFVASAQRCCCVVREIKAPLQGDGLHVAGRWTPRNGMSTGAREHEGTLSEHGSCQHLGECRSADVAGADEENPGAVWHGYLRVGSVLGG